MNAHYTINISQWGGSQTNIGSYRSGEAMQIWQEEDGWYGSISGISQDGLGFETDKVGPETTPELVALELLDMVEVDYTNQIDDLTLFGEDRNSDDSAKAEAIKAERDQVLAYIRGQIDLLGVLTTAEAEAEFDLAEGTAKKAAQRGTIPARKAGGVWLIERAAAMRHWGKVRSITLLLVSIALTIALRAALFS